MKTAFAALPAGLMALAMMAPLTLLADQARDMDPDGRLSMEAQAGDFVLIGHDQDRLLISSAGGHTGQPAIGGDAGHWSIRFDAQQAGTGEAGEPHPVEIRIPHGAEVEARLGQGSLSASGLHGALVQLQVVGGSVSIRDSKPASLFVETVDAGQSLGSLAREETRLQSVGGEIRARGEGQRLAVQTVSGPVRLDIDELVDLELQSLSGDTRVRVRPAERAVLRARSNSAPLAFELPADTPLNVRAESHSGAIESAFGGSVEVDRNGNRRLAYGGGPDTVRLEMRSVDGPIRVDKLAAQAQILVFDAGYTEWTVPAGRPRRGWPAGIAIEIDEVERIALRPGQFSLLDLPLEARQITARQDGFDPIRLDVVELEPMLYCFRLNRFHRVRADDWETHFSRGFEFDQVDCPDADFLAEFEEVSPHPPEAELLVFTEPVTARRVARGTMDAGARQRARWRAERDRAIFYIVGTDQMDLVALRGNQFARLELPLGSHTILARHSLAYDSPTETVFEAEEPGRYCLRVWQERTRAVGSMRFGDGGRSPTSDVAHSGVTELKTELTDCPDPDFFANYLEVDARLRP